MKKLVTNSEKDTIALGKKYGKIAKGSEVFLLLGDLGSGKTQFAKGLALGLGVKETVTSPTFNYENIYKGKKGLTFYHFDLYRSNKIDNDIRGMMLEAFSDKKGVTVVEWAEKAKKYFPKKCIEINFKWISNNERELEIDER